MQKFIKRLVITIIALLVILIAAGIILTSVVNPNRFKPLIIQQVAKYTGRELEINGDIAWRFFPYLQLRTEQLVLKNPAGFDEENFAEVQHASIAINLLPLLHKEIKSSGITLDGVNIHLVKNAKGANNWTFAESSDAAKPGAADSSSSTQAGAAALSDLAISAISLQHAQVQYDDAQQHQSVTVDQIDVVAKEISFNQPFPLSAKLHFTSKNPKADGNVSLTSLVLLTAGAQDITLNNFLFKLKMRSAEQPLTANIQGNATVQLANRNLQLSNIQAEINGIKLQGGVTVNDWQQPVIIGQFNVPQFATNKLHMQNIVIPIRMQNQILQLAPVTADLYQGQLRANTAVNLQGQQPRLSLQAALHSIQMAALLQDLSPGQKLKLQGVGDVNLNLQSVGQDSATFLKNLQGNGNLSVNNGVLQGIDIGYLLNTAAAILDKHAPTVPNRGQTDFGRLQGSVQIQNGVLNNNDLQLDGGQFTAKGDGTIDLVTQRINYRLQTQVNQSTSQQNNLANLYGIAIPIIIKGDLTKPTISLDTNVLLEALAKQQLQKNKQRIQQQIQKQLPAGLKNLLGN